MPKSVRPPKNTAILPLPGIPKRIVGTNPPPSFALFADSGAMTPLISPLPNLLLSFEV